MNATLRDISVGESGTVAGYVKGTTSYRKKLLAMGLTKGTSFTVARIAPMGDPVEIQVRGFALSLRKDEASALLVERGKTS
jgi:ferrous iron transport protein A